MTKRLVSVAAAVAALLVIGVGPAAAITHGQPDGNNHPYVGMVVTFSSETPSSDTVLELCSGTLISPTVFVTAGHCTVGAESAEIWFGPGPLQPSDPYVMGRPVTVDDYVPLTHDLGAVLLDEPYTAITGGFPTLPSVNQLDSLKTKHGSRAETFTTVGYGMERSFPPAASWKNVSDFTRMVATPRLIQIDGSQSGGYGMVLSGNANTGGVCVGDSGGPDLTDGNVIAGITVGVHAPTCAGNSLALRLDRQWSLDWLGGLLQQQQSF